MAKWKIKDSISNVEVTNGALHVKLMPGSAVYPEVNTFADLPAASSYSGSIYVVLQGSGIYIINRKSAGLYLSNGTSWSRLGDIPAYFSDANFKVYDNADNTKKMAIELSSITTGNTRTLNVQDIDGVISVLESSGLGSGEKLGIKSPDGVTHYITMTNAGEIESE